MKKIFNSLLLIFLLAATQADANTLETELPFKKQAVWRATLIALASYPLELSNYEQGEIKTKIATEGDFWSPLHRDSKSDHIYTIELSVYETGPGTRVTLNKKLKRKAGFNRNEEEIKTENVEEDLLLYRIKRELVVDRVIKKNF